MDNPWRHLSSEDDQFVLEIDSGCIQSHNRLADQRTRFETHSIPEPFIGNPETAAVVFLGKNPGHGPNDEIEHKQNVGFRRAIFQNLQHRLAEYPFYPLNPSFSGTGAGQWWVRRTKELQEALGGDVARLSQRMMVIEWFPYHSISFRVPKEVCCSQKYSFELVKQMLNRGTLVVGMRARSLWQNVDRKLVDVPFLRNPQCGHISRGNTDGDLFDEIVAKLKS